MSIVAITRSVFLECVQFEILKYTHALRACVVFFFFFFVGVYDGIHGVYVQVLASSALHSCNGITGHWPRCIFVHKTTTVRPVHMEYLGSWIISVLIKPTRIYVVLIADLVMWDDDHLGGFPLRVTCCVGY